MFWDNIAFVYDLFENIYNRGVYNKTGVEVAKLISDTDSVLECACGTGAISKYIAPKCKRLIATDFSVKMLAKAKSKLKDEKNVLFEKADITKLSYVDNAFDVVVAGNVIHLLDDPQIAIDELKRVCKKSGKIIVPTYINESSNSSRAAVKFLEKLGASFKRQFDIDTYKIFFEDMNCKDVKYTTVKGRMSCCIAIIELDK